MKTKPLSSFLLTFFLWFLFCATTFAQTELNRTHKESIEHYLEEVRQQVDSIGYKEVRKKMIAENEKKQTDFFTKESYYQQLALLKVMLEKERNNFITSENLLYETYEDYLSSKQKSNDIKSKIRNMRVENDKFLFSGLEKTPTFKECAHLIDNLNRKSCLNKKIAEYISENYNAKRAHDIVKKNNLLEDDQDTYIRTFIEFKIDKKGAVVDVKGTSVNDELTKLGERLIQKLPRLDPASNNGKKVTVIYTIPITFMVTADN